MAVLFFEDYFATLRLYLKHMKLSREDIQHVATLARLELSDSEIDMYTEQLSVVLEYVGTLGEVETEGVEETCQVTGLEDVVRKDEVKDSNPETKKKIIESFPDRIGNLLKVKAVFTD